MESKIEFLKKMESKAAAGETQNVDDTLTAVNNVARETFETVEKTMREFGDQQTELGAIASEQQREFGGVKDQVNDDETRIKSLVSG